MKILVVHHVEESFCGDEWQQMDNAQSVVAKFYVISTAQVMIRLF